jgi:putative hydrolase of the HAD superfamily
MQADAVFFDAGNTLIHPDPPVGQVYSEALRAAGADVSAREVERRFRETFERLAGERARSGAGAGDAKDWWRRVVRECFAPYAPAGFEKMFQGLWDHFARGAAWMVYEDVTPTFEALRARGKMLGLVSNWDERLEGILKELGLARWLDCVVISHQVGAEKPEPAIFRRAARLCGLAPGRILHVGDSYEQDVLGARAAGMQAVWLRRAGAAGLREAEAPPQDAGVPVVTSLSEMLELLE